MDCVVKSSKKQVGIKKQVFNRKSIRKDGLLLQVHHTLDGQANPIRFLHAAFQEDTDTLAVSDVKGNVFIIDLTYNRFWALPNVSKCSGLAFPRYDKSSLFISSTDCLIKIINFENGKELNYLRGHKLPPSQLTFGGEGGKWLLSAAPCLLKRNPGKICLSPSVEQTGEAIVWDLNSCIQAHRLNIRPDSGIKKAIFMDGASSGQILVCFEDDAMFVWQLGKFECRKQILPVTWNEVQHNVKSIAVTRNGRAMVVGGKSHSLVAFSLDTWKIEKIIELPDGICGIKHLQFLSQPFDGGSNRVLAILTSNSQVFFLDLHTSAFIGNILNPGRSKICKLVCSQSGCYIACVLESGEVNIYSSSKVLGNGLEREGVLNSKDVKIEKTVESGPHLNHISSNTLKNEQMPTSKTFSKPRTRKRISKVGEEIKSELDPKRLLPILRQVGEFPLRYRLLAWRKALLQLPCNQKAYASLVERGIHPSFAHLDEKYPLENLTELKNLKRLVSCLAHWSPLFSQVTYLPLFTYPFVKLFIHDPYSCFEAVITIIINYCQHWFEFFPFPPINVLAAVENLLAHHDSGLLQHFVNNGIDTRVYAWPILQVLFSEVLSNEEWLRLWDHILANEPSFLLAAVAAYCIVCRSALLNCKNIEDFQYFFQNQNPINMDKFISKIYYINKSTPPKLHPGRYLQEFKCLPEGDTYPVFNQYPKILVDGHAEKLKNLQEEEEEIIRKELATLKLLREKEEQKILAKNALIQQKHLSEVENAYQMALKIEEEKVANRRLELMNLKKELAEAEDAARKMLSNRDEETKTNLQLCLVKKLLKEVEHKVFDSKQEPISSREADVTTLSGRLSPLSYTIHQSSHFKGGQRYSAEEGDKRAFPKTNPIQNIKKEIRNIQQQIHKRDKEKGKAELVNPSTEFEYNGWVGEAKYFSGHYSEEECSVNESEIVKVYRQRHKNEQVRGMCLKCSPQKHHEESSLTSKLLHGSLRDHKPRKVREGDDEINFIREEEKHRWQLDPTSTKQTPLLKHSHQSDFSTLRNKEFYSKEQNAIQQAMEARASIIHARNKKVLDSASSVT